MSSRSTRPIRELRPEIIKIKTLDVSHNTKDVSFLNKINENSDQTWRLLSNRGAKLKKKKKFCLLVI